MRRIRVHVEQPLAAGQQVPLPERSAQHLLRVLRLADGDAVTLFNGDGHDYAARLRGGGRHAHAEVLACTPPAAAEAALPVVLLQALARGEKMDWVLQKATELGVAAIVPVLSERTEVRLAGERVERRMEHWRGVVASACEQCGRAVLPTLSEPLPLDRLASLPQLPALRLYLHPEAAQSLATLSLQPGAPVAVAIGPEGGWSERDLGVLHASGFDGLRLGPRVLRTETAGPAVLAALQARFGDLA